jgi:electron transfer flavoprotein alpha subunit
MADVLVYSEKTAAALELVAKGSEFAAELGLGVSVALLGPGAGEAAGACAAHGAGRVFVDEDVVFAERQTDTVAEGLARLAQQCEARIVLLGSTRRGKELAGRLAQKLGAGCVTDVNSLVIEDGRLVAGRYAFGGATVARERVETAIQVLAVMPKTFEIGVLAAGSGEVVTVQLGAPASAVQVVERRAKEGETVDLTAAARIVGVGRGFAKREDLPLGERLAAALAAELACTKSLADFAWMPEDRILGLSGAKTKPDLYLAVGVSGQIQHTVGVSSAKLIAAVNTDKEAPIFALADYGIVGDLYEVVPAILARLEQL